GGISLLAALTIWPQRPPDRLRGALADAVETLARRVGRSSQGPDAAADSFTEPVRDALALAGPDRLAVGERPTLATERDLAVVLEDVVHPGLLGGWLVLKPP